jgi:hypothetical protein
MRRWLLILAAAVSAIPLLWLVYAWFTSSDANLHFPHSTAHLHADQQGVEVIYTSQASDPAPDDFDRDWSVMEIKRNTFSLAWGMPTAYTTYVVTSPQLCLTPLMAILPTLALLQLRRDVYRRLQAPMPAPPPMPTPSSHA